MTTEPFADQHATIEAAQHRICEAEEQIFAALARIPKPPGAITGYDEWRFCELAGAYSRYLTMGHWEITGDGSPGIHVTLDLHAEQTETGALRDWNIGLDGLANAGNVAARIDQAAIRQADIRSEPGRLRRDDAGQDGMTAEQARRLAAALLDAAAALDAGQQQHSEAGA